jgi:hypothetical protein
VAGPFVDVRGKKDADYLDPDISTGHPAGQKLAEEIRECSHSGVIYPSIRKQGGLCLAAFRANMVQDIRQGGTWRLTWSGDRDPGISAV